MSNTMSNTTTSNTTTEQIIGFIRGRFPQVGEIAETADIFSFGHINSLFATELVMYVEKSFGVTIPNHELRIENFRTAQAITELVDRLRPAVSAA